jgi:hypothetical protein
MKKRIETLERQRIDVSDMNGRQCRQIRRNRSVKADPPKLSFPGKPIGLPAGRTKAAEPL